VRRQRRQVQRGLAPAPRLVAVLAERELDEQVAAMQAIARDQRLVRVLVAAELLVRGRESPMQIGDERGRRRGERRAVEDLAQERFEVFPPLAVGVEIGERDDRRKVIGHRAERLEQAALGGGLDTGRARQRRELREQARLLGRRERFVLELLLEQSRRGLGIAAFFAEPRERPRRLGVIRAQREHAVERGRGGGEVTDALAQHVAGGHQRGDLDILVLRALGLAQLRIGERARILVGRGELCEHRERGRMLGHERERVIDRDARARPILQLVEP
jgi:hypothetical protein